ncbi:Asp-tRNA(Asn)/Glu-tRNA(Gln) amidotransferase GatCAB subunit B [Halobacteriales archaeon QS_1_68_20]|nr:MAG: Asp-tRNA(Asn)/Glu-tRNA(Gln) amidotransferase GatCAB subunit B [Halobacteriales archaeon QS_1_68_20]
MTAQTVETEDLATVIGLEVHVQLETETKIFCGCSTDPSDDPNTNTCPVCLGLPGALPVVNEAAVEAAVKVGKAIDATIPEETTFHRKNYYYPDLPKNFQITQYDDPICQDGELAFSVEGERRSVEIRRAHLEEDPGSLQHVGGGIDTADYTLVDYNRAGTPLMEVVTEPDFRSPGEVRAFLAADEIDESTLDDADPNRTEVKNISSHRGAEKALAYEETRQKNAIKRGRAVEQETRHWDESKGVTLSMRSKEEEKDYRYFREADLPPLRVADWKERLEIPELPDARRKRFREEYGLSAEAASKLTSTKEVADFFENVASEFDADLAATWVADELLGELNYRDMQITDVADRFDAIERLVELVATDEITTKNARETVLRGMLDDGDTPDEIVEREGLGKTSGDAVRDAVEAAIDENPDAVSDYHDGEDGAINFLVGQVMQKTGGSADPGDVNQRLREELEG